jgi:hypothetical protein
MLRMVDRHSHSTLKRDGVRSEPQEGAQAMP